MLYAQGTHGDRELSSGGLFQGRDAGHGLLKGVTAHFRRGLPTDTEGGPLGLAEEDAFVPAGEIGASSAGRLAAGHVGHRRGNRRCDATRAALPAIHRWLRFTEAAHPLAQSGSGVAELTNQRIIPCLTSEE